jgi:hypothetical protein
LSVGWRERRWKGKRRGGGRRVDGWQRGLEFNREDVGGVTLVEDGIKDGRGGSRQKVSRLRFSID